MKAKRINDFFPNTKEVKGEKSLTEITSEKDSAKNAPFQADNELLRLKNMIKDKSKHLFKTYANEIRENEHLQSLKNKIKKRYK